MGSGNFGEDNLSFVQRLSSFQRVNYQRWPQTIQRESGYLPSAGVVMVPLSTVAMVLLSTFAMVLLSTFAMVLLSIVVMVTLSVTAKILINS